MDDASLQFSDKSALVSLEGDTLVARLNALRARLGSRFRELSVRDFARALSEEVGRPVSASTVMRWTSGKGAPDAYEIVGVARLAQTSVEQFMDGLKPPGVKRQKRPTAVKTPGLDRTRPAGAVKRPKRA